MTVRAMYILDSLNRGGAEMLCLDICRNAVRNELDLIFVATGGGDLEVEFERSGTEFIRFQRKLPIDPALVLKLRQIILRRKINVIHTQQAVEAIHAYLASRGTGAKCVMSLQNYILDRKNRIATKLIVPRMDAVCPVSKSMQDWFSSDEQIAVDERFFVLHNGVDPNRLAPTREAGTRSLRNEINAMASDKILGMVGNFYPDARKDQLTICKALPEIFERHPNIHFVFVGAVHPGAEAYNKQCIDVCKQNGVIDKVHFVGKRSDIPDILAELDIFVFSSVQEGLPVAAVEALMLGTTMTVSDIPPLLEVIGSDRPEGACADIFKVGDPRSLAASVNGLLDNDERRLALGEKARSETIKQFGIDNHIGRLKEIYNSIP